MNFYDQVVKEFNKFPHTVAKAAELLAKGDYVCVLLGDGVAVATTWDDFDISAIARKVELEPREDGSLIYICWTAGTTIDHPAEAATIAITTKAGGAPEA
jgi:cobalamin biosynthesis protein CbiG